MTSNATESPMIYIIAGPNGAGKTTFANKFLPEFVRCTEFLNADVIAAGLSPFAPQLQNVEALELMLQRMDELGSPGNIDDYNIELYIDRLR